MAVTKKTLDDIRKELKRSGTEDLELTSREIVFDLAPAIHEQMRAGAKLMSLYAIVKAKLPAEARLSEATFKKYWRDAREELALAPFKASGRKGPRQPAEDPKKTLEAVLKNTANATSLYGDIDLNDLFPDDPDDPQINTSTTQRQSGHDELRTSSQQSSGSRSRHRNHRRGVRPSELHHYCNDKPCPFLRINGRTSADIGALIGGRLDPGRRQSRRTSRRRQ